MDARNSIKEIVSKEDLRKGVWAEKSEKSLERMKSDALKKIIAFFLFLICLSILSMYGVLSSTEHWTFFLAISFFSIFALSFLSFFLLKYFRKMRMKEERMKNSSSAAMLHEFGKYDTITYHSMAEVNEIDESTIEKIAKCIKDSLTDMEDPDAYTFNISFIEEDEIRLIITPRISSDRWVLYDGHSPFFIDLELVNIPDYEEDIFGIQIVVKREERKKVAEVIEKIKETARECALKFIEK